MRCLFPMLRSVVPRVLLLANVGITNKTFAVEMKHRPGGKQLANRLLNRGAVE